MLFAHTTVRQLEPRAKIGVNQDPLILPRVTTEVRLESHERMELNE